MRSATFEFHCSLCQLMLVQEYIDRAAHVLLVFGFVCVECLRHFPFVIIWYYKIISSNNAMLDSTKQEDILTFLILCRTILSSNI